MGRGEHAPAGVSDNPTLSSAPSRAAGDDHYPGTVAIIKAALVAVAVTGMAAWLVLGLSHLGDRYKVGHVQGIWMALARYAHDGTLYPPLFDGVRFGGTRYMPLPIVLNAAASRADRRVSDVWQSGGDAALRRSPRPRFRCSASAALPTGHSRLP